MVIVTTCIFFKISFQKVNT